MPIVSFSFRLFINTIDIFTLQLQLLFSLSSSVILTNNTEPIAVAERSAVWFCCSSRAWIAGSNRDGGIDVCLLRVLCVVR